MTTNYEYMVIAPSHMCPRRIQNNGASSMFDNCLIHQIDGLANWSGDIPLWISTAHELNLHVFWMISDWSFNNKDIFDLQKLNCDDLFLPGKRGSPGNIVKELRNKENTKFLVNHTLKIIDKLISDFPNIKLIFWCLYTRTKLHKSDMYDEYGYDEMCQRYPNNYVDIDLYLHSENITFDKCVVDNGGHPSYQGYSILKKIFSTYENIIE